MQGLKHCNLLSITLIDLVLENIVRKSERNKIGLVFNKNHLHLVYSNDIIILAISRLELEQITVKLIKIAEEETLEFNTKKLSTWN